MRWPAFRVASRAADAVVLRSVLEVLDNPLRIGIALCLGWDPAGGRCCGSPSAAPTGPGWGWSGIGSSGRPDDVVGLGCRPDGTEASYPSERRSSARWRSVSASLADTRAGRRGGRQASQPPRFSLRSITMKKTASWCGRCGAFVPWVRRAYAAPIVLWCDSMQLLIDGCLCVDCDNLGMV